MRRLASIIAAIAVGCLAAGAMPRGGAAADDPVLTVVGAGDQAQVSLTLDDLRKMGATEVRTSTPWTEGMQTFVGVTGAKLVQTLKADGKEVATAALDDYRIVIPFDVFASDTLLIAYERNGKPMSVREKGPLWVIFPFDSDRKYLSDTYRSYAIWSLKQIEIR